MAGHGHDAFETPLRLDGLVRLMFVRAPNKKSYQLYSVVQGNKAAYKCGADSYDAPIAPEVIAACKTLMATD